MLIPHLLWKIKITISAWCGIYLIYYTVDVVGVILVVLSNEKWWCRWYNKVSLKCFVLSYHFGAANTKMVIACVFPSNWFFFCFSHSSVSEREFICDKLNWWWDAIYTYIWRKKKHLNPLTNILVTLRRTNQQIHNTLKSIWIPLYQFSLCPLFQHFCLSFFSRFTYGWHCLCVWHYLIENAKTICREW